MEKTFDLNEKGKIELTKEELKNLLDDVYYLGKAYGYAEGAKTIKKWTYKAPTPNVWTFPTSTPLCCTTHSATTTANSITLKVGN